MSVQHWRYVLNLNANDWNFFPILVPRDALPLLTPTAMECCPLMSSRSSATSSLWAPRTSSTAESTTSTRRPSSNGSLRTPLQNQGLRKIPLLPRYLDYYTGSSHRPLGSSAIFEISCPPTGLNSNSLEGNTGHHGTLWKENFIRIPGVPLYFLYNAWLTYNYFVPNIVCNLRRLLK